MNLGYFCMSSPYTSSGLRGWHHTDPFLEHLQEDLGKENFIIHSIVTPNKGTLFDRLKSGSSTPLTRILKKMKMVWYEDCMPDISSLDAIYIDSILTILEGTAKWGRGLSESVTVEWLEKFMIQLQEFIESGKSVIIHDVDGATNPLKSHVPHINTFFRPFIELNINRPNLTIIAPFVNWESYYPTEWLPRIFHVPFIVNPDRVAKTIVPKSSRKFLSRYVGNNFYRSHLIREYLGPLSNQDAGRITVNGAEWGKLKTEFPKIEWGAKFGLTIDMAKEYSQSSVFQLFSIPRFEDMSRAPDILPYRIKECLEGGVLIIPEAHRLSSMIWKLDASTEGLLENLLQLSDTWYDVAVREQSTELLKYFSSRIYYPRFKELLGVK